MDVVDFSKYLYKVLRARESDIAFAMSQGSVKTWEGTPWCKEGQWVCIGRYSGSRFKIDGGEVRILNDDEVIATLLEPDDVRHV